MLKKIIILILLYISFFQITNAETLKVGIREREPFSYKVDGKWSGFAVDLWEHIANKSNIDFEYKEYSKFGDMIEGTKIKDVDLSIGNISITFERSKIFDFSHPIFNSGLNIIKSTKYGSLMTFKGEYLNTLIKIVSGFLILLIVLSHIYWLINITKRNLSFLDYFTDIIEIIKDLIYAMKARFGSLLAFVLPFTILIFVVGYFTEEITQVFTDSKSFETSIDKKIVYKDLKGTKVGVIGKSTSQSYLNNKSIGTKNYDYYDDMYDALKKGDIKYIVADDPILRYNINNSTNNGFTITGELFSKEGYGFIYPNNSNIVKKIDITLLETRENGKYREIYNKYFSEKNIEVK